MRRPLLFLNLAHAYDHFFLLILPTAVLALAPAWGMSYGEALALGTAAFVDVRPRHAAGGLARRPLEPHAT